MKARRFLNLMIVSLVAMTYTSCSNSDDVIVTPDPVVKTYTMTVDAQKGSDGTRALSLDGSTLNSTWTAGDEVEVWTSDGTTKKYGELTAQTAGASTTLSGTLTELPSNDESLLLKYLSPDYNSQKGTIESISSHCDYSTAMVTATVAGSAVTTTTASFANQQAVIKFTLKNADGASLGNPTAFSVTDGTSTVTLSDIPDETYSTNGNGVLYVAFPASGASATITLSATVSGVVYGLAKTDITFTNSKYYGVTVKMTETKTDVLPGKFTVNASGDQIRFSPGNLQYTKSTSTWSFMDHQYSTVETANQNVGNDYASTDVVSLFGWGTSNQTIDNYGSAYQPWSTNMTSTNYGPKGTYNLTDSYANGDWGVNIGSGWRTLTQAEWAHLFNTRTASTVNGTSNARYAKAKVNNVQGVILFPDSYTHPAGVAAPTGINATGNEGWNGNVYDATAWGKMESAGCVFLPAAGGRDGSSVGNVGYVGGYWSSTADGGDYAYVVGFGSDFLNAGLSNYRYYGFSVRLVRPEE